jgi:tyrosine-protein phosphatase YwqE
VQVTAGALLRSDRRSKSRRTAIELIDRRAVHVIASDAHRAAGGRAPRLSAAVDVIAQFAPARAEWMVTEAPAALLAGEPLPEAPEDPPPRRRRRLPWRSALG